MSLGCSKPSRNSTAIGCVLFQGEQSANCSVVATLCHPMNGSPPGNSVYGILQARILEWLAISFSRGSSPPRDRTRVSCIAGRFFTG